MFFLLKKQANFTDWLHINRSEVPQLQTGNVSLRMMRAISGIKFTGNVIPRRALQKRHIHAKAPGLYVAARFCFVNAIDTEFCARTNYVMIYAASFWFPRKVSHTTDCVTVLARLLAGILVRL